MSSTTLNRTGIDYSVKAVANVLTPALAIYADIVEKNIDTTIALLGNNPARWRPHVKTAKLLCVMQMLTARDVRALKCATTLELFTACEAGANDILLAFAVVGANARRVVEIASTFPQTTISVLVDAEVHLSHWTGTSIGVFIDINSGMNRTGISQETPEKIVELVESILRSGIAFRGLHYYDGHLNDADLDVRTAKAHAGYDRLLEIVRLLQKRGVPVPEIITAGTPAFPCTMSYSGFSDSSFTHRASPGTVVYGDLTSQSQLPASYGLDLGALVISRVVSLPTPDTITCDAGHKAVSADAGVPTCAVLGWQNLIPSRPSEEHLPITGTQGTPKPLIGEILYLVPKHVCPTVNNFSQALLIRNNEIVSVENVNARGHEA